MGKKPSVIQINGNRYDAVSGHIIGKMKGPVIDGLIRRPQLSPVIKKSVDKVTQSKHKSLARKHPTKTAHNIHSRTQRSKTLMRSIVAKPNMPKREASRAPLKGRVSGVSPARISKAMHVAKNTSVRHFSATTSAARSKISQHTANKDSHGLDGEIMPAKASAAAMAIQPAPNMITSVSSQRLERMLDEALLRADAHKKALSGRLSSNRGLWQRILRLPTWVVVMLTVIVAASGAIYFAWSHIPAVSMKIASLRSSVEGSVPAYVPTGFKFAGPIQYQNGSLTMKYKTAESGEAFTLTENRSNLDSTSLKANIISPASQVQTFQVKGATIYYDSVKNVATWVSNGKQFQLNGKLDPNEVPKIAGSVL